MNAVNDRQHNITCLTWISLFELIRAELNALLVRPEIILVAAATAIDERRALEAVLVEVPTRVVVFALAWPHLHR